MILSKFERKMLYAMNLYQVYYITPEHLHGYFNFCDYTKILTAVQFLESENLIYKLESPQDGYRITDLGERWILQDKENKKKKFWVIFNSIVGFITAIAALNAIFPNLFK